MIRLAGTGKSGERQFRLLVQNTRPLRYEKNSSYIYINRCFNHSFLYWLLSIYYLVHLAKVLPFIYLLLKCKGPVNHFDKFCMYNSKKILAFLWYNFSRITNLSCLHKRHIGFSHQPQRCDLCRTPSGLQQCLCHHCSCACRRRVRREGRMTRIEQEYEKLPVVLKHSLQLGTLPCICLTIADCLWWRQK